MKARGRTLLLVMLLLLAGCRAGIDIFDHDALRPVGAVRGVTDVHGVRVAPDLHRIFATATGTAEVVTIDTESLQVVGRAPTGHVPAGLAYDPSNHRLSVSNKNGGSEPVLDARTGQVLRTVPLGKEAGNVIDDPTTRTMLSSARPPDELAAFDATRGGHRTDPAAGLPWGPRRGPRPPSRRAFVACEDNARLAVVDLAAHRELSVQKVGSDPDVLGFDAGLGRLCVAAESGVVTVFAVDGRGLRTLGRAHLAPRAHSVAVGPRTHNVFFPLENVGGYPVMRVMQP